MGIDFILKFHSFIIPNFDSIIPSTCHDQTKVMRVITCNNVSWVSSSFTSKNHVHRIYWRWSNVFMNFNGLVPRTSHDRLILSTIPNVWDFRIMPLDFIYLNSTQNVEYPHCTIMISNNQLSMLMVEFETCDVRWHALTKFSHRLSDSGVPNLDVSLTSDVEFHSDWRVVCADNWVIIRQFWGEGFWVFKHLENPWSTD